MAQGIHAGRTVSSIPFGLDRNGRPLRIWRKRRNLSLGEAFLYPIVDGPGIALLIFLPPFLAIMSIPVFDLMVQFKPGNALNPIVVVMLPIALPLIVCFILTLGYVLIFFGRILSMTSVGEDAHPKFPVWDRVEILEELARWFWAGMMGLAIGGFPAMVYWINCGEGISYAQMALVASLLHETLAAANPVTVLRSIYRIGWNYFGPCVVTGLIFMIDVTAWIIVLLHSPNIEIGVLGLWACWVFTLYAAMLVIRTLGTVYYKQTDQLSWFKTSRG
jgi:hypothetical protein